MMSFDELELLEDGPHQYINPEVLATEVPKQFFIDLKEWINGGCFPDGDKGFVAGLGICYNLATYMGTEKPKQYWYRYMTNLFDGREYPFGKDDSGEHQYIGSSDIISRRLQFIDYNIAHLPGERNTQFKLNEKGIEMFKLFTQFKLNEKGIEMFKLFLSKRHPDEYIDNFNFGKFERHITLEAYMANHIVYKDYKYTYKLGDHCHSPMSEYTSRQLGLDPDRDYHKLVLTRNEVDIIS